MKAPKLELKAPRLGLIAILVALAVVPLFLTGVVPIFFYSFVFVLLLYNIFASNLNVLMGYTGYINFGHVVFFGVGAYVSAILMKNYGWSPLLTAGLGGILAGFTGLAIGYFVLGLKGIYFGFATISLFNVFMLAAILMPWTDGPLGIALPLPPFGLIMNELVFYEIMLFLFLISIFISYKVLHSKYRYGFFAIRSDEDAAASLGVDTFKLKLLALFVSAIPTGVAGGIYVYYIGYIDPGSAFSFTLSWFAILMVLLGGRGTVTGPIVGASLYFVLSEYLRYSFGVAYEGLHMVIFCIVLIAVILFMPKGIIGWVREKFPKTRKILI